MDPGALFFVLLFLLPAIAQLFALLVRALFEAGAVVARMIVCLLWQLLCWLWEEGATLLWAFILWAAPRIRDAIIEGALTAFEFVRVYLEERDRIDVEDTWWDEESPPEEPEPQPSLSAYALALKQLGLPPTFTPEELKHAYRKRVLSAHPDAGGSNEQLIEATRAYELLAGHLGAR